MPLNQEKFAKFLIEHNLISKSHLDTCLKETKEGHFTLEECLLNHNLLSEERLRAIIKELFDFDFVKLSNLIIQESILKEIPFPMAKSQNMIAFDKNDLSIKIALCDPENQEGINFIRKKTGLNVEVFYTTPQEIKNKLNFYHNDIQDRFDTLIKSLKTGSRKGEIPMDATKILDTIIILAHENKASDIHIEPHQKSLLIRYRIDGILRDIVNLPKELSEAIETRVKVLSNLRTDEHRSPQDGRFKMDIEGEEVTLRVSIIPIYEGEKIVLRLLISNHQNFSLEDLGYCQKSLLLIQDGMRKSHGMILVTGPTGSGKTTALYAILRELNTREVNISTIEDPIEYRLEGINQIQANRDANLSFATGLRALLRQDPDIIMVGEIRDNETANIAVNAALTGHLVLATLHTNDAASTLIRLIEMEIEPFLVSSTVIMAIAQRLVRKICKNCLTTYEFTKEKLLKLSESLKLNVSSIENLHLALSKKTNANNPIYFANGAGCKSCNNSGYSSRTCISEVIAIDENIRKLILENRSPDQIRAKAKEIGMESMFEDGIEKVLKGITTIEEILRVMRE